MSMSTNDVEQISNNRVINQESHVYFVKFGINLPLKILKNERGKFILNFPHNHVITSTNCVCTITYNCTNL